MILELGSRWEGTTLREVAEVKNRDFMVAKVGNEYLFYALRVIKIEAQIIHFEGELDVFFTYRIDTQRRGDKLH